jgi:hypothetical protein
VDASGNPDAEFDGRGCAFAWKYSASTLEPFIRCVKERPKANAVGLKPGWLKDEAPSKAHSEGMKELVHESVVHVDEELLEKAPGLRIDGLMTRIGRRPWMGLAAAEALNE